MTSALTPSEAIAKLREIEKAMRPKPWAWEWASPGYLLGSYARRDTEHMIDCVLDGATSEDGNDSNVVGREEDRDGIATMRNVFAALLDVATEVEKFYGTHEYLGWGGHEALGEKLEALARAVEGEAE